MPIALPNTTVADSYPGASGGAQVAGNDIFSSGWFTVANHAVLAEYEYGIQGQLKTGPEMFLAPGTYPMAGSEVNPLQGIRFKNAVAGSAAQVWGAFFYKNDPVVASSSEFSSQVSASGGVTPTPTSSMITGHFNGAGAIVNGTGFTVVRNALGNYNVTYTVVQPTQLIVVAQVLDSAFNPFYAELITNLTTGFQVVAINNAGTLRDQDIYFLAATPV